ncbi:MAG: alpha/beta hydrolase family protein [Planctomycetales bacterium]
MKTFLTLALLTGLLAQVSFAADVEAWLAKPILDPNLPQRQVEDYCEARVLRMPEVESAKEWEALAKKYREDTLREVVFRGEAAKWREMETKVKFLDTIEGGPEYRIRKLIYEAVPGLWIPALLYEPKNLDGPAPVVLNVNGHDRKDGKAADYKQTRCINQAKRGMIALNVEWVGMGQLQSPGFAHYKMNQLDLCGTSGLAPFYLSMSRGLDILLQHKHADPDRVAVAGLSGGGWQTIIISSLDERVTLSDPVAGYSSFLTRIHNHSDLGDSEQTPVELGAIADYAHLTAMRAPRPTLLTFNLNDNCCFASPHALQPLLDAAKPIYKLYDKEDSLRWHVNEDPGTHNFGKDNRQALYRMFGTFFYPDDKTFDANEIACEDELKTKEELQVPLPEGNADFHSLAVKLSESLPKPPSGAIAGKPITNKMYREELAAVLRLESPLMVTAEKTGEPTSEEGITGTQWKLHVGDEWTLPAVELAPAGYEATSIVLGDAGRKTLAAEVKSLLARKHRVIAIDPFYLGESRIPARDFLFALTVSTVGRRPLGIQTSQISAVAEWAKARDKDKPVHVHAFGPRTSLMALCAKAARGDSIDGLHLTDGMASLKEVITQDIGVNQQPELFCFGLLENFDIPLLKSMAGLTD